MHYSGNPRWSLAGSGPSRYATYDSLHGRLSRAAQTKAHRGLWYKKDPITAAMGPNLRVMRHLPRTTLEGKCNKRKEKTEVIIRRRNFERGKGKERVNKNGKRM